jgi:tetratricopeptide (TPR) repeat protein
MPLPDHLATLERADLVRLLGLAPDLEYAFRHALVQDAAYASLLRIQRALWHRAAAEVLEQLILQPAPHGPERDQLAERLAPALAVHHANAGQETAAIPHFVRAGEAAFRRFANAEAAAYFDRALALALRQPAYDPDMVRHLYSRLGRAQELGGQLDAALQTYIAMLDVAQARGDQRLALAALMARATLQSTASYAFDQAATQAALEQARAIAHTVGDQAAEARLTWTLMLRNVMTGGDPDERLAYGETAVRLARDLDLREQLAYALLDVWYAHAGLGRWAEARSNLAEASVLWASVDNPAMQSEAESRIALTHLVAGEFDAGLAAVARAHHLALLANSPHMEGLSRAFAGRMLMEQGRLGDALALMETVIELAERTGNVTALIGTRADLALACALLGDLDGALALARQAIAAARGLDLLAPWPRGAAALLHLQRSALDEAAAELAGLDYRLLRRQLGFMPFLLGTVGLAAIRLSLARREFDPAAALAQQLLADLRQSRIVYLAPEVQGLHGEALLAQDRLAQARAALQSARVAALAIGARRQLWPILAALARVEAASGQSDAAGQHRAEARALLQDHATHTPPARRAAFLAQPAVQALLSTDPPNPSRPAQTT